MFTANSELRHKENSVCVLSGGGGGRKGSVPWLSVEVLFMSPEMKEDSDCFLTVSFHIRLMRLWVERKAAIDYNSTWCCSYSRLVASETGWLSGFSIQVFGFTHALANTLPDDMPSSGKTKPPARY